MARQPVPSSSQCGQREGGAPRRRVCRLLIAARRTRTALERAVEWATTPAAAPVLEALRCDYLGERASARSSSRGWATRRGARRPGSYPHLEDVRGAGRACSERSPESAPSSPTSPCFFPRMVAAVQPAFPPRRAVDGNGLLPLRAKSGCSRRHSRSPLPAGASCCDLGDAPPANRSPARCCRAWLRSGGRAVVSAASLAQLAAPSDLLARSRSTTRLRRCPAGGAAAGRQVLHRLSASGCRRSAATTSRPRPAPVPYPPAMWRTRCSTRWGTRRDTERFGTKAGGKRTGWWG
jgi:hypothetical protein